MANREQKGNREKRKPKAGSCKTPPQTASFAQPTSVGANKAKSGGKKGS